MPETKIDSGITANPKLSEKIKKLVSEYGWVATIIVIIGSYQFFVWEVNEELILRADVERDLQGQVSELKAKVEILLQDRNSLINEKYCKN